jgi:hypothetical protein
MERDYPADERPPAFNPQANDHNISVKSLGVMKTPAKSDPRGDASFKPIGPGSADWERGRAPARESRSIPVQGMNAKGAKPPSPKGRR